MKGQPFERQDPLPRMEEKRTTNRARNGQACFKSDVITVLMEKFAEQ